MKTKLEERFDELSGLLINRMNPEGFWTGELSASALGVAVAVAALHFDNAEENEAAIWNGLNWLTKNCNADGSFGDTPESPGNISTTLLVYAAVNLYAGNDEQLASLQEKMKVYLLKESIDPSTNQISSAILAHYKKDYTFSVPILTMCALCGIPQEDAFSYIPQLPFELSLLPRKFYRMLNLSVVSYAIPALVAVGIVIFRKKKSGKLGRWIRNRSVEKALVVLEKMMPESGGFLEAIPLTAFVSLSLIHAGYSDSKVVREGISFLKRTQRPDGSWPIDVDLSTWVTTLSVKALRSYKDKLLPTIQQERVTSHLLSIQNRTTHIFNGTEPGGWGWTSYSGSVPDCDDTPGVVLALLRLQKKEKISVEVLDGCRWLLKLQNKDGGFPTFSKGWGKLPFDQSCADLTGHCLLALAASIENYETELTGTEQKAFHSAIEKSVNYLSKHQHSDGSWQPLWFGNQHTADHSNPVYGTARVLTYLQDVIPFDRLHPQLKSDIQSMIDRGITFLTNVQNADGSWGGYLAIPGTIEETSLAISALIGSGQMDNCRKGFEWLDQYYLQNGLKSAPIGLYFASLWYDEKMYPLTTYLEAITRALECNSTDGAVS